MIDSKSIAMTPTPSDTSRNAALESAAQWHDAREAECRERADRLGEQDERGAMIMAEVACGEAEWHAKCAAAIRALPVTAGEPVAWHVSAGEGSERHIFFTDSEANLMAFELQENGWLDVTKTPLYATPQPVACPAGPESAARNAALEALTAALPILTHVALTDDDPIHKAVLKTVKDAIAATLDLQSKEKR